MGQIKRAYIEAGGTLSIYKYENAKPGLSILPVKDIDTIIINDEKHQACSWCGTVIVKNHVETCPNCSHDHWVAPSKEFIKDE
jgi:uncharacterized membrane protein YcaP (DUF421 family)